MLKIVSWIAQTEFVLAGIISPEDAQALSAMTDGLLQTVLILAIFSLSFGLPILLRSLNSKALSSKNAQNLESLILVSKVVVLAAEQMMLKDDNIIKYEYALKMLTLFAKNNGMRDVNPEICRMFIESAVIEMKRIQADGSDKLQRPTEPPAE